ncbi:MAG: carotenoid oxygenase family protein [Croceibacterium sp.]
MVADFSGDKFAPPGFNSPTRFDGSVYDCEVSGTIPADLHGTFYRMQCDFAYPTLPNDWMTGFNGDGHVSMFRFKDGSVDYTGRYVMTDRLIAERAARRRLFGVYRNRLTDDPSVANIDRGAANTHIYWHAGKMMVLKEDSLPYLVDPHTLETKGRWDFHGKFESTSMSAHPKIDPVTGDMICYGYQAKGDLSDDIAVYVVGPDGHVKKDVWFKAPYVGIVHDIAITRKHIVIPVIALVTSLERLQSGEPMWDWQPSYPTMVAILPRDGDARDIRWFKGPSRNTLHFNNAVDVGNTIQMDLPVSDEQRMPSQIKRWTFDLNSKDDSFKEEVISTTNGPLVRMNDKYLSMPYEYCYAGHQDASRPVDTLRAPGLGGRATNTYQRVNVNTGETSSFFVGSVQSLQEPIFAPRENARDESDGYVMGVASNYAEMKSELVIVDAQDMEAGAIATVKLPFRLRPGTHGNWLSAKDLEFA